MLTKPRDVKFHQNVGRKNVLREKIELREGKSYSTSSKNMLFEQDPAKPWRQFLIRLRPGNFFPILMFAPWTI